MQPGRDYCMKKKRLELRILLSVCAALGWWGMLYPQLAMTPDTYRIIYEDETVQESADMVEWDFDSDIYRQILEAEDDKVQLRSKLFDKISAFMEHRRNSNESGK